MWTISTGKSIQFSQTTVKIDVNLFQGQTMWGGVLLVDAVCWGGGVHQDHGLKHHIKNAFDILVHSHLGIFDHILDKQQPRVTY